MVVGAGHGDGGDDAVQRPAAGARRTRGAHLLPREDRAAAGRVPARQRARGAEERGRPRAATAARAEGRAAVRRSGFNGTDTSAEVFGRLARLDLGGVVLAGGNYVDVTQLGTLASEAATVAREHRHVPPWVFASQEGGELNSFPDLPPRRPRRT